MKKYFLSLAAMSLLLVGGGCTDTDTYDYSTHEVPVGISISVTDTVKAVVGDSVQVIVTIDNQSGDDQVLHSIDIGDSYLEGINITSSVPMYSEAYSIPDGTTSHTLLVDVAKGATETVTFTGFASSVGSWTGAFYVCFEDGVTCEYFDVSTLVE